MTSTPIVPIILAGGAGERLWPLSKSDYPKQFVAFEPGFSLFQQTLARVADRERFAAPVIVCNHAHRFIVSEQLRAIGCTDAQLLIEPLARNTAPALALAALHVAASAPEATLLVMPSDHRIADIDAFCTAISHGLPAARDGYILTFAVTPTTPETGYGYIHIDAPLAEYPGIHRIGCFIEKPDRATAQTCLEQGNYGWNSGIFLLTAATALNELRIHAPDIFDACRDAYAAHTQDAAFLRPARAPLQTCRSLSIDYALMEHTTRGVVAPVAMGWSDLGSWTALDSLALRDAHGNAAIGPAVTQDAENCYLRSDDNTLIAAFGVRDLVIVAADRAVLIGRKDRMTDMKQLLEQVRLQASTDLTLQSFAHRPWGSFYTIDRGAQYQVKKLHLKPGGKISLQAHEHRSEHWVIVAGRATVTNGDEVQLLHANQSTYIPAGTTHRLENREATDLVVIEVQTGEYLGEDDITRMEDVYDRTNDTEKDYA